MSTESIAEAIWGDVADEKFSLYSISKHMERLRKKIEESGISQAIIHSQRGEGYLLYD